MRTVILKDKLLKVSEDGTIIRLNDDLSVKDEAKIYLLNKRGRNYPTLSVMIRGIQKNFYAHRVIAETFIPNPNNHRFCEIIDGNPYNLNVDNLRWMSEEERMDKVLETTVQNSIECDICGHLYHKNNEKCTNCERNKKIEKAKEINFKNKLARLNDELSGIDTSSLKPKNAKVIEMRRQGNTLQEIADEIGITREGARKIIITAKNGGGKSISKQSKKIDKLKEKINKLEFELAMLKEKRGNN